MRKAQVILLSSMIVLGACQSKTKLVYPVAEKGNTVDNYFGTEVADPYRWLENDTSQATAAWVEAENQVTNEYLTQIPFREQLKQRLTDLVNYERIGIPQKKNGKYYFFKNNGLQNQNVLYVKNSLDGEATILLDPNTLSTDGTVALAGISLSNDGKYMAYTLSRSGSDWREIYVIDLATRKLLDDHILWAKFSGASWKGDGFYYSAYDAPTAGKEFSNVNENHKIYYHKLGEPQSKDVLVFQNPKEPKRFYSAETSEDERVLFIVESGAGSGNNLFIKDLTKANASVVALTEDMEYSYYPIEVIGNTIYLITNYQSPKYRIMTADIASPKLSDWKELVPENEAVLSGAQIIGGRLILTYDKDASNHAYVFDLDGKQLHEITLPALGSVGFSGNKNDKETFYSFTSFTYPATIFKYDIDTNVS
ncbi:MAG: S9 family peptidase, partial [Dysgonamonadaceae bacterium]|nr:S9 family peptidase [Dysgonamonadaceae bacterium]